IVELQVILGLFRGLPEIIDETRIENARTAATRDFLMERRGVDQRPLFERIEQIGNAQDERRFLVLQIMAQANVRNVGRVTVALRRETLRGVIRVQLDERRLRNVE